MKFFIVFAFVCFGSSFLALINAQSRFDYLKNSPQNNKRLARKDNIRPLHDINSNDESYTSVEDIFKKNFFNKNLNELNPRFLRDLSKQEVVSYNKLKMPFLRDFDIPELPRRPTDFQPNPSHPSPQHGLRPQIPQQPNGQRFQQPHIGHGVEIIPSFKDQQQSQIGQGAVVGNKNIGSSNNYPSPGIDLYPTIPENVVLRTDVSEQMDDQELLDYNPFTPNQPYNNGLTLPTELNLLEQQAKDYFDLYDNSASTARNFCETYKNSLYTSEYLQKYCNFFTSNTFDDLL